MNVPATQRFIKRIIESNGDVYRVLGLDAGASAETIKKAYRRLVVKVHPDKCLDKSMKFDCDVAFKILQKSYERALAELSTTNEPIKKRKTTESPNATSSPMDWEWSPPPPPPVPQTVPLQGISTRPLRTRRQRPYIPGLSPPLRPYRFQPKWQRGKFNLDEEINWLFGT